MEKQKLISAYPWDAGKTCVVCGSPYIQRHHIFGGSYRKAADRYGYAIPLCAEHHTGDSGIHFDKDLRLHWRRLAQEHFEAHIGNRQAFIACFGKNYL